MSPGTNYIDMMINFEGEVHHPYLDSAGIATIGIGSTRYENGAHVTMADPTIDHYRAIDLLLHDTLDNQRLLNTFFPDGKLTQSQNDALLSLMYNIGAGNFQTSTVLKLAQENPADPAIRAAFCLWDKEHIDGRLVFSQGLYDRRMKEADIYFSPDGTIPASL